MPEPQYLLLRQHKSQACRNCREVHELQSTSTIPYIFSAYHDLVVDHVKHLPETLSMFVQDRRSRIKISPASTTMTQTYFSFRLGFQTLFYPRYHKVLQ